MQLKNFGFNWCEPNDFSIVKDSIATDCAFIFFRTPVKVWTQNGYKELEASTGMLWTRGVKQIYYPVGIKDMVHDFIYINFDTDAEKDYIQGIPMGFPIYFPEPQSIIHIMEVINNEIYANTKKQYKYEILPRLIEILFYKIRNNIDFQSTNPIESPYYNVIGKLRYDIYNNVKYDWTIKTMSEYVNLSPSHFQKIYKQFFLITPTNDVIRARIANAKSMLRYSSKSIYETANECGYKNVEHFIRQFKKNTQLTPKQYRNNNNN